MKYYVLNSNCTVLILSKPIEETEQNVKRYYLNFEALQDVVYQKGELNITASKQYMNIINKSDSPVALKITFDIIFKFNEVKTSTLTYIFTNLYNKSTVQETINVSNDENNFTISLNISPFFVGNLKLYSNDKFSVLSQLNKCQVTFSA
ncbi:MAG: hypothetical protein QW478_00155 [Candidatus Micrarchaeaceae archaeon]